MAEPGKNDPEQHSQSAQGQRQKADEVTRKRVDTRQELGNRAEKAQDRDGEELDPARDDQGAPAQEQ